MTRSHAGKRSAKRRRRIKRSGAKSSGPGPAPRNPIVIAAKRLDHRVTPSIKAYSRKGKRPPPEDEVDS
jgi:hypothetical protein